MYVLRPSRAISRIDVESETNVSEISSVSIVRASVVNVKVKVKFTLRPTASQSVLMSSPIWD
jgi:hypothetical protein